MARYVSPDDICVNCGCPRWKHHQVRGEGYTRYAHCKVCGSKKCWFFRIKKPMTTGQTYIKKNVVKARHLTNLIFSYLFCKKCTQDEVCSKHFSRFMLL